LDDFGAGQASLAQLRRLPMDFLKVDRALVAEAAGEQGVADAAGGRGPLDAAGEGAADAAGGQVVADAAGGRGVMDAAGGRAQSKPLIDVVVSLGRRLGLEIIAEGLESAAQIDQARAAGCRFGQGFGLSRPATAERVEAYLEEFPAPSR
jgi:EAL domain-containing protein (putative c-di-GMP-specific phosphodiesterase class I)